MTDQIAAALDEAIAGFEHDGVVPYNADVEDVPAWCEELLAKAWAEATADERQELLEEE